MSQAEWTARRDQAVAEYRRLGFSLVALRERDKLPIAGMWPAGDSWGAARANSNVGILTGRASGGLVVLDFDDPSLAPRFCEGRTVDDLARLTRVHAATRGPHVFARSIEPCSTRHVKGLDVYGDGGQVVAPPSVHPSGTEYRVLSALPPAPLGVVAPRLFELLDEVEARERGESPGSEGAALGCAGSILLDVIERAVEREDEKLVNNWRDLRRGPPSSGAYRKDFAVCLFLAESGFPLQAAQDALMALPGSEARIRGASYARRTASKAYAMKGHAPVHLPG